MSICSNFEKQTGTLTSIMESLFAFLDRQFVTVVAVAKEGETRKRKLNALQDQVDQELKTARPT